jgi:hypothetical protein
MSKTATFRLMSDFTPYELAPLVGKSGKQIGRYCAAGCFGKRATQTAGGHWRITAPGIKSAAAFVRDNLPGSIRKPGGGKERAQQRMTAKLGRAFLKLRATIGPRLEMMEAAGLRMTGEELGEEVFQQLERCEGVPGGLQTLAVAGWMFAVDSGGGRVTQSAVAKRAGMSLSTFLRKYGQFWAVASRLMASQLTRQGELYVVRHEDSAHYAEPVEMPANATSEEIRRWSGACRAA